MFNPFVRSRLRDAIGRTVLCGDTKEHTKAGTGTKHVFFDSDYWKASVQKAFLAPVMSPGSCSLYNADQEEHAEFAIQFCNEKLKFVKHCQNGKDQYFFNTKEPHDYLDCMSMCYAVAATQGISGEQAVNNAASHSGMSAQKARIAMLLKQKPRVRVV